MRLLLVFGVAILVAACESRLWTPTEPTPLESPSPSAPPAPVEAKTIEQGQTVEDRVHDFHQQSSFQITTPASGTLAIHVSWEAKDGRLELWYDERPFYGDELESIVARIPVFAGMTYRFQVSNCCAWEYGVDVPFVLTTSFE